MATRRRKEEPVDGLVDVRDALVLSPPEREQVIRVPKPEAGTPIPSPSDRIRSLVRKRKIGLDNGGKPPTIQDREKGRTRGVTAGRPAAFTNGG
jgi:hypothetical protein